MPRPLHRLLIALLLALAIPAHALAASSAGLCAALERHSHGEMDHHHASGHHEGAGQGHENDQAPDKGHCPPVTCCAVPAIAPALLPTVAAAAASRVVATPPGLVTGTRPAPLDRPPLVA